MPNRVIIPRVNIDWRREITTFRREETADCPADRPTHFERHTTWLKAGGAQRLSCRVRRRAKIDQIFQ